MTSYALGLDYGSDSVRALLVDALTGKEVASHVVYYPRWKKGLYSVPAKDQFRQHPLDYLESLEQVVQGLWTQAPAGAAAKVVGIGFDTTGSTPIAVDSEGMALALKPEFAENPNAMFVLWKDHTAIKEAQEITAAANASKENYLKYEGGIYSLTETGILTRFDAKTGKQTFKTRIDPTATAFTTSPWAYNGKLFCLSEDGDTFVIQAGNEYKLLGKNSLDELCMATPAIAKGSLIIRTASKLYRISNGGKK